MTRPAYYAHSGSSEDRSAWHKLSTHLKATGERAGDFLGPVNLSDFGRAAGLLHDLGKYTGEFQKRLAGGPPVDHATAGAKVAIDHYRQIIGKMLAFCIAGHHAGLANGVNGKRTTALADRLGKTIPSLDPIWKQEITLPALPPPAIKSRGQDTAGFCAAFLIRMVFSALVDADYLDTEAYFGWTEEEAKRRQESRGRHPTPGILRKRLDTHLAQLMADADASYVNRLRQRVLTHVRSRAQDAMGVFTLTVPTGGGKTLTSLAFALDHAVRHDLDRVIYVIPYMSIIEQTASVFREALRGDDADEPDFVIEHHSTFDEEPTGQREAKDKLRLAMENWDAPVIVTTAVQFFESLFANRPLRCRKLHNIANSVVILDEAQTLPIKFLRPCVTALDELARNWHSSVVLCTATQPDLTVSDRFPGGFENARELAPEPRHLYRSLKRTTIKRCRSDVDDAQLAEQLRKSPQVLCIVNTRRHARKLHELIRDVDGAFHLTTLMCAHHRREKLATVRDRLKAGAPVRLIATSLVEAGVDLDFPVVWRAEAGLESIIQAAGRCNREGNAHIGDVFVFKPAESEGREPPPEIAQSASAARYVMRRHADDPMSLEAIDDYFKELYWLKDEEALDAKYILRQCRERRTNLDFPFETIANEFQFIETAMRPVIVPWRGAGGDDNEADRLLAQLEWKERPPGRIARELQPYVVQIPPKVRSKLLSAGALRVVREDIFEQQFTVLVNLDLYRSDVGLIWDDPTFQKTEGLLF